MSREWHRVGNYIIAGGRDAGALAEKETSGGNTGERIWYKVGDQHHYAAAAGRERRWEGNNERQGGGDRQYTETDDGVLVRANATVVDTPGALGRYA